MGSSGEARDVRKSYFDVLGLCCSSEVPLIEKILKQLDGIKEVTVIVPTRTVIVVHDNILISQIQIVKALNQARLEANIRVYGEQTHRMKWPSPYTIGCGTLLMVSFFKSFYHPLQWFAVAAVIVGLAPIGLRSIAAIRNLTLDINILMLVAVGGSIALKDYLEAGTIVFLFTIAEWLESKASHKATAAMTSLLSMAPQQATLADNGAIIDAKDVKVNTILAVKAGEVIPIDGIVVEGVSEVDEKTLTGESTPVSKQKDSNVWAGTINLNGYITVKTTALAEECVVAKMAMLVEEAQNNKSSTQRLIDDCTKYYTPFVVSVALSLAVIPAALKLHNLQRWFHLALVVLVSACPCALILSTPVATFCTLTKAAATGVLIKGGDYLEILAQIKTMAFDKTGTITRGEFVVTDFRTLSHDVSLNTLLYWVSSIESKSSHPMAAALVDYGRSNSIQPKPEIVTEFENFPGEGIYGEIDGKIIFIGNKKIARRAGSETVPVEGSDTKGGATVGYIYLGGNLIGIFSLSDACRTGVVDAITELKKMNIKTVMLTGDSNAAAIHAQQELGHAIEVVHAELLPEDKARIITNLKKEQLTAMIGDGINDAPALATADIGISMGISGSALATETGQLTLMSNDIRKVPQAIKLARKSRRKVIENIILSISTKVAVLALACSGHPLLWAAVLVDVGTCIVVILNSMLLLRGTSAPKSHSPSHAHKHNSGDGCGHHHKKPNPSKSSTCCNPDPVSEQCCSHEILHCENGKKSPSSSHVHKHNSGDGCGHHHKRSVLFKRSKWCNQAPLSEQCCSHQVSQCESGKKSPSSSHAHTHNSGDGCGHHYKGSVSFLSSKCNNSALVGEQCCSNEVPHCGSGPKSPPPPHGHELNSGDGRGHHSRPVALKSLSCNHSAPMIHEQCCSDKVPQCGNGTKSSSSSSSTHSQKLKSEGGCGHHKGSVQVKSSNCSHLAPVHGQCCSDEVPHSGNSASASNPPTCSVSAHSISINCERNDHNDEPESKCEVQEVEDGGCCKGQCSDISTLCHAKDEHEVSRGISHCESMESHACMSLERREIGGCCRSFMKECEGKHQCLSAKLGGLSEIIIAK